MQVLRPCDFYTLVQKTKESGETISFHPRTYNSTYCGGTYESDVTTFNPRYEIEGIFTLSVIHNGITLNGDGGNF